MSDSGKSKSAPHTGPDGTAWRDAQKAMSDRNDEARKNGRQQRQAHERKLAISKAERERGTVYR